MLFKTAGVDFACDFDSIIRIDAASSADITPAPSFPDYMSGTVVLDGEIVPVVDTAKRFGLGSLQKGSHSCFILARLDDSELKKSYDKLAAWVDEINGSAKVSSISPPPALNDESFSEYVAGTFLYEDRTYYVITPEKLAWK